MGENSLSDINKLQYQENWWPKERENWSFDQMAERKIYRLSSIEQKKISHIMMTEKKW